MKKQKNRAGGATPRDIPLAEIRAADWNVHSDPKGDGTFEGLVASMRANGMIQRITVRAVPNAEDGGPSYEVVDGHRRVEAARELGWDEIPADVVDAADEEAQLMTATANVQRLANDPLLESALIGRLREAGRTYAQIAAAMGEDERYVARRARLASLSGKWRGFFRKAGAGADMADMMETVARHDTALQDAVFARYVDEDVDEDGPRFDAGDVAEWFADEMLELDPDETPFNVEACATCPRNTATHRYLFPEYADKAGRCQAPECFARKWNAEVDARISQLNREGVRVREAKDRWSVPHHWESVPRREPGRAAPYLYVDDAGLKRLVWTREDKEAKAARAAKTDAERAEERRVKAAHSAWAKSRLSAFEKIRREAGSGDPAAFAHSLVRSEGFLDAVEGRYARMFGRWLPDDEARLVLDVLGAETLGLTAEEAEAMASEDPAAVASRGQAETSRI